MIKDPVLLPACYDPSFDLVKMFSVKSGERFIRTIYPKSAYPDSEKHLALYFFDQEIKPVFSIVSPSSYYINSSEGMTAELFLETLKEKHPDHFEWFLFNLEWLAC